MSDYQETIAELRAKAAERELVGYQNRAAELDMEISNLELQAIEAANQGDDALALSYAAEANAKNAEAQQILQQLPQQPQYSQRKLDWAARRPDLVNHPQFAQTADAWHRYITGNMNVPDDSDDYERLMSTALEPQNYEPLPSPDELIKTVNETSKYCRQSPLTAKQYNKHVENARARVNEQLAAQGKKL